MAKKGNMNIDNDDFEFDDEMFPLDDSVYDDDDDLAGFKFDPNEDGPGGAKGFFVNTMKSIKGIGVDFVDEFLPEAVSLGDDIKSAIGDSKDVFLEKKDKVFEGLSSFKSNLSNKANKESAEESKGAFKNAFGEIKNNIKSGKFYTSNRDIKIDMDAFLDDDDEENVGESTEEDTSGSMTTSFNYKRPRRKNNLIIVNQSNDESDIAANAALQETSTASINSNNKKLFETKTHIDNSNFKDIIAILSNISNNIYGLSDFLEHYGKTNINAQLEYDSKSLAFLTDQRALLKDILAANNRAIGIKSEEELAELEENEDLNLFGGIGSFSMDKYAKQIKENAMNMFSNTQLGQTYDMMSGMAGMIGKDSGLKLNPLDIGRSMAKSFVFNNLLGSETKNKLGRLNDLYGNIGGTIVSKMNRLKDSDNSFLSFMGNLLGQDTAIDKNIDLTTTDLDQQTVFDGKTKETITETIPGYLAQILNALNGSEIQYYNYDSHRFETQKSISEKYDQIRENVINGNVKFSKGMSIIEGTGGKLINDNKYSNFDIDERQIQKAMDKFKENLIQSKIELNPIELFKNKEYRDKMFRGFEAIGEDREQTESIKDLIAESISSLSPGDLRDINNSILKVASEIESTSKQFKESMVKFGNKSVISEMQEKEKWEKIDYDLQYSSKYNEDLAGKNEYNKMTARRNKLLAEQSMYGERVGKVDLLPQNINSSVGSISDNVKSSIDNIYDLLLNGIKVYPITPETNLKDYNRRINELGVTSLDYKKYKDKTEEEKKKKENDIIELRKSNSENSRLIAEEDEKRRRSYNFMGADDDSMMGKMRYLIGFDNVANAIMNPFESLMNGIIGKEATEDYLNNGGVSKDITKEALEEAKKRKALRVDTLKDVENAISGKKKNKSKEKQSSISSLVESIQDISEKGSKKLDVVVSKKREKEIKKKYDKQESIKKNGTYLQQIMGSDLYSKIGTTLNNISGDGRAYVYLDPVWFEPLDDKTKLLITRDIIKNGGMIVDSLDEETDIYYGKIGNLDSDDKKLIKDIGIKVIDGKYKNINEVSTYLKSNNRLARDNNSRFHNNRIKINSEIENINDRDEYYTEKTKHAFDVNEEYSFNEMDNDTKNGSISRQNKKEYKRINKEISDKREELNNNVKENEEKLKQFYKDNSDKYTEDGKRLFSDNKDERSDEENEIAKVHKELLDNLNKSKSELKSFNKETKDNSRNTGILKYKNLAAINSPKSAGNLFIKEPKTKDEIDALLSSGDESAIFEFANKIKSSTHEGYKFKDRQDHLEHLDPEFKLRLDKMLADPALQGANIQIKDSIRSPLRQFALYSKGRVDPKITKQLMFYAGLDYDTYFPESIKNAMGENGIVARTLSSNHMTGRAIDLINGNMKYGKIASIAAKYGIKWAGKNDQPHFEFDERWNENKKITDESLLGQIEQEKKDFMKSHKVKTLSDEKSYYFDHKYDNAVKNEDGTYTTNNEYKEVITGKPLSFFQSDPAGSVASGEVKLPKNFNKLKERVDREYEFFNGKDSNNFFESIIDKLFNHKKDENKTDSRKANVEFKTNKDILMAIYNNTNRIADNTEKIGFGIGIPGVVGSGLFGKIGSTAKDMAGKVFGFAATTLDKGLDLAKNIGKGTLNAGKKGVDFIKDKFDLTKESVENLIIKYGLEERLGMSIENIRKKYSKEQIIKMIKDIRKEKSLITKGKNLISGTIGKGKDILFGKKKIVDTKPIVEQLSKKLKISKSELNEMSYDDLIKLAKENGIDVNDREKGILTHVKDFAEKGLKGVSGLTGNILTKGNEFLFGKTTDIDDDTLIEKIHDKTKISLKKLKQLSHDDLINLAKENGIETTNKTNGLVNSALDAIGLGDKTATTLTGKVISKSKDILFGKKADLETLKDEISKKLEIPREKIENLSREELLNLAKEKGLDIKDKTKGLVSHALDFGKGVIKSTGNLITGGKISSKSVKKIIEKIEEVRDAVYEIGGIKIEKVDNKKSSKDNKRSLSGVKRRHKKQGLDIINRCDLTTRLNMSEDDILEIYSYKELKAIEQEINENGKITDVTKIKSKENKSKSKVSKTPKATLKAAAGDKKSIGDRLSGTLENLNVDNRTLALPAPSEGSYQDQKNDKETKEEKEDRHNLAHNIASIAAVIGTPQTIAAAAKETAMPNPDIGSLLMANYQNSEKQGELLEDIKNKPVGKGDGGGNSLSKWSKLGTAGGKIAAGIQTAGGVATIGAAAAGAAMLGKQVVNKFKTTKLDWKNSSVGEKVSGLFGAGGSGNYDNNGNEITDKNIKAGKGFGLNQAVHVATFAKGVSKLPAIFTKFSGLVAKLFKDPKLVAKIGGKAAADSVSKAFIKSMEKSLTKGGAKLIAKISSKITAFCAKISNGVGWAVMVAQLVYDIGTGMAEAPRYFKMGKGMKPTWPMRITAGLAKAISGNLTLGLIPPDAIANLVFGIIGSKATKEQMKSAEEFDKQRASIMEVEYGRLVEFETMTWTEIVFGQDKKRATILGFMKDKKDKGAIERFKTWFEKVYKPLDDMYKEMIKANGGKVDKKINPDDVAALDNQAKFREEYLKAAKAYMAKNKLSGLGPLGKGKSEEDEIKKHDEETAVVEKETDENNLAKENAEGTAELSKEGINLKSEETVVKPDLPDAKMDNEINTDISGSSKISVSNNEKPNPVSNAEGTAKPITGDNKDTNKENELQADGINFKKMTDSKYFAGWNTLAKLNESKSNALDKLTAVRNGIKPQKKGFKAGLKAVGGKLAKGAANLASKIVGASKNVASGATNIFSKIKGSANAIGEFVTRRKQMELELSSKFNDETGVNDVIALQKNIVDKNALGQQKSTSVLSPVFAERVEAFLKDPRVQGHGVSIRESYRPPATQLAYYSKGRSPSWVTDKLMKYAGFKDGINFWPKSFQKPGDYITWTLASNHFNGSAVDLEPGDIGYDKLGAIAKEYGIDWGGYWSTPDKPHFELGDPNFKLPNTPVGGSATVAQTQQADAINFRSTLKNVASNASKYISNIDYKKLPAKISNPLVLNGYKTVKNKAKETVSKLNEKGNALAEKSGVVTSNLVVAKFDELYNIASEGVEIMRELLNETKRHNQIEEVFYKNLMAGIAGIGAAIIASNNNGFSTAGSSTSITKGMFDKLANGL